MPKIFPQLNDQNFHQICDELASRDQDLHAIIKAHGYPPLWNRPNSFESLVHIILEQQVSLASALAALKKLKEKLTDISPENFLLLNDEELKACYFSRQKSLYTRELAKALVDKKIALETLLTLSDDEVRSTLIALKGIGNWTIDIYLLFVLQRTNVFPLGDLAVINALRHIKKLPKDTPKEKLIKIANKWQPYMSVATMILWHHYLSAPRQKIA